MTESCLFSVSFVTLLKRFWEWSSITPGALRRNLQVGFTHPLNAVEYFVMCVVQLCCHTM